MKDSIHIVDLEEDLSHMVVAGLKEDLSHMVAG